MQQNNGNNMDSANLIGGCLTKLFRACSSGGDGSTMDIAFLNGIMAELLNVVCKSCQVPATFDSADPDSYNQIWTAITRFGGSSGIKPWVSGTTDLIVESGDCAAGCTFYLANTDGEPSTNEPSTTSGHWYGPYCSISEVVTKLYDVLSTPDVCFTPEMAAPCSENLTAVLLPCGDGTYKIGYVNEASQCTGVQRYSGDTKLLPASTSSSNNYNWNDLAADIADDSVDQSKLDNGFFGCFDFPIPCDDKLYSIAVSFSVEDGFTGFSRFAFSIDGVLLPEPSSKFSSASGGLTIDNVSTYITPGTTSVEVCCYVIGTKANQTLAQIALVDSQQPTIKMCQI